MRRILSRLKATFWARASEERLREDMEAHLSELVEAYVRRGLSERDARMAAMRAFGSGESMKESYRDEARFRVVENLIRDVGFALRQFRKTPGFTALAVFSLALGIGANTALFSLVHAILLKQLPVPEPGQLKVFETNQGWAFSYAQVGLMDRDTKLFDGIGGRHPIDVSVEAGEHPRWVASELVTGNYFRVVRISAERGRLLTPADLDSAEGDPVCTVSYRFWQRDLHGDPEIVGRKIHVNTRIYRIVGVTQKGFAGVDLQQPVDLQLPASRLVDFMPAFLGRPNFDWKSRLFMFTTLGRLRPSASLAGAESEAVRLLALSQENGPSQHQGKIRLVGGEGGTETDNALSKPAMILFAVSGVVLLIACANLATLLIARTSVRAAEFAIRLAIGCSRRRVVMQMMTESGLLGVFGALLGIGIAYGVAQAILRYLNRANPAIHQLQVAPEPMVLWFAIAASLLCVLLFGTAPAIQAASGVALGSSAGNIRSGAAVRKTFVAIQITLSLTVLLSAGLLTRTLSGLQTINLGFHPDEVVVVDVRPAAGGYSGGRADAFYNDLVGRVRALPGIKAAATTVGVNLTAAWQEKVYPKPNGEPMLANIYGVGPGYLDTIGARLLAGHDFSQSRQANKVREVIVNAHLAKTYFGSEDAIGRYINEGESKGRVIGVVSDVMDQGLRNPVRDTVYQNSDELLASSLILLARCEGRCGPLMPEIRRAVADMDVNTPIHEMHTMQTEISGSLSNEQILGFLSALFAGLSVLLIAAGLYGVTSCAVTQRTREIGLRVAIGATVRDIVSLVMKEAVLVVAVGMGIGLPLALGAVQLLQSQLFGVSAHDAVAVAEAVLGTLMTAFLAFLAPLRRAVKIEPQQALRVD